MLESQIGNITPNIIPNPFFGHNLCFKCPNGSNNPILDIYILKDFQWCKELFNPMFFDLWNCLLKIWKSIKTPTPKVGAHLGVWGFIPSNFPTLLGTWNVTPRLHSKLAPLRALTLVASPRLRSWHYESTYLFTHLLTYYLLPLSTHLPT
jgi:hypothetical protein